ncbi:MAG: hypothetical protein JXM71_00540 [Spirochaetales bacterium]|nr:hypothetical protein [Spirochaetales bacterium]
MKRACNGFAILTVAAFAVASPFAQEAALPVPPVAPGSVVGAGSLEAIPAALISEALAVSIVASVSKPDEEPSWEARDVKYTIPGTAVSVKMLGSDVAIVITLTPYKTKDGGLLIVAQGQVWYHDGEQGLRYQTTVDTLSVRFGETVLFYPFGTKPDGGSPLRVELIMDRYVPPEPEESAEEAVAEQDKTGP